MGKEARWMTFTECINDICVLIDAIASEHADVAGAKVIARATIEALLRTQCEWVVALLEGRQDGVIERAINFKTEREGNR